MFNLNVNVAYVSAKISLQMLVNHESIIKPYI
jgi:hypothetical protein